VTFRSIGDPPEEGKIEGEDIVKEKMRRGMWLASALTVLTVNSGCRHGYFSDRRELQGDRHYLRAPMLQAVLVLAAALADIFRPRWSLLAEIALLRHQLAVLQRSVARPRVTWLDRIALVALAVTPTWRNVLRIVQPETILRWHRAGFKALWRWRSRARPASRLVPETVTLIRSMASANRLWGAERIRGELLKLGVKVSKRTIQKYMRAARPRTPRGQRWRHSYETTQTRFGLATSCKLTTYSSARSSRSCSSNSPPAKSFSPRPRASRRKHG
jgi:hypothetical protein